MRPRPGASSYSEKGALHRRERLAGRFDRAVTMPIEINREGVKAEYRDGILALFLPRADPSLHRRNGGALRRASSGPSLRGAWPHGPTDVAGICPPFDVKPIGAS